MVCMKFHIKVWILCKCTDCYDIIKAIHLHLNLHIWTVWARAWIVHFKSVYILQQNLAVASVHFCFAGDTQETK